MQNGLIDYIFQIYLSHSNNSKSWSVNPFCVINFRFDPGRFDDNVVKSLPKYSFEPFGFAGKRKCPGYRFAYVELTVVLATLLRNFKFDLVEGQVVESVYGLVTKPKEEIWFTVSPRK